MRKQCEASIKVLFNMKGKVQVADGEDRCLPRSREGVQSRATHRLRGFVFASFIDWKAQLSFKVVLWQWEQSPPQRGSPLEKPLDSHQDTHVSGKQGRRSEGHSRCTGSQTCTPGQPVKTLFTHGHGVRSCKGSCCLEPASVRRRLAFYQGRWKF